MNRPAYELVLALGVALTLGAASAGEPQVTGIKAFCRDGQVFVTWKDVADGEAGAKYRYTLYRSDAAITQENVAGAMAVIRGIHNNSCKTPGTAYMRKDRLDPARPRLKLTPDGEPLPLWTGVGVHTVVKDGKGYYAVVATDPELKPLSKVVPGESATTEPVEEKVAPPQPIRQRSATMKETPEVPRSGKPPRQPIRPPSSRRCWPESDPPCAC